MSIKIRDKSPKTYIVLGAPHSATSFVAKLLHESGIEMHPMNENFEDLEFNYLNRRILKQGKKHLDKAKELIERKKSKSWGWKAPLTSKTLDSYLPFIKGDVYLICCFRKPERVIKSWIRSKHTSGRKPTLDKYNRALLKHLKEFCEL